ncbi:MAG: type II toxin-antitoxin system RelE/ParE family toxin [Actinomycetota bacterium]|nr:type II toxin-antitoxin system RelE/ParE family toxin [Actinomycetota bacterium]MDP3630042.1 type II toxin-antitoxin system RelE/ParE family toxin [Actinomycetota bacterium]
MSKLWILSDALVDIESAREWYEIQRPGLGDEFLESVDDAIESVLNFPAAYPVDYREARRFLVERFPYCLYYRLDVEGILVVACLHAARDPVRMHRRLRG